MTEYVCGNTDAAASGVVDETGVSNSWNNQDSIKLIDITSASNIHDAPICNEDHGISLVSRLSVPEDEDKHEWLHGSETNLKTDPFNLRMSRELGRLISDDHRVTSKDVRSLTHTDTNRNGDDSTLTSNISGNSSPIYSSLSMKQQSADRVVPKESAETADHFVSGFGMKVFFAGTTKKGVYHYNEDRISFRSWNTVRHIDVPKAEEVSIDDSVLRSNGHQHENQYSKARTGHLRNRRSMIPVIRESSFRTPSSLSLSGIGSTVRSREYKASFEYASIPSSFASNEPACWTRKSSSSTSDYKDTQKPQKTPYRLCLRPWSSSPNIGQHLSLKNRSAFMRNIFSLASSSSPETEDKRPSVLGLTKQAQFHKHLSGVGSASGGNILRKSLGAAGACRSRNSHDPDLLQEPCVKTRQAVPLFSCDSSHSPCFSREPIQKPSFPVQVEKVRGTTYMFTVADGHDGSCAADYVTKSLPELYVSTLKKLKQGKTSARLHITSSRKSYDNYIEGREQDIRIITDRYSTKPNPGNKFEESSIPASIFRPKEQLDSAGTVSKALLAEIENDDRSSSRTCSVGSINSSKSYASRIHRPNAGRLVRKKLVEATMNTKNPANDSFIDPAPGDAYCCRVLDETFDELENKFWEKIRLIEKTTQRRCGAGCCLATCILEGDKLIAAGLGDSRVGALTFIQRLLPTASDSGAARFLSSHSLKPRACSSGTSNISLSVESNLLESSHSTVSCDEIQQNKIGGRQTCVSRPKLSESYCSISGEGCESPLYKECRIEWITNCHRFNELEERTRLAGYEVCISNDRIAGILEPTRTIGDFDLKVHFDQTNVISHQPDIKTMRIHHPTMIVVGTDGVCDVLRDDPHLFNTIIQNDCPAWLKLMNTWMAKEAECFISHNRKQSRISSETRTCPVENYKEFLRSHPPPPMSSSDVLRIASSMARKAKKLGEDDCTVAIIYAIPVVLDLMQQSAAPA